MKDIIYLNTDIMNSMIAQLDEGLINSFTLESSTQETDGETTQTTRSSNGTLNGGLKVTTGFFPGGSLELGGSKGAGGSESEAFSRTILDGQKDILNKAFHDHALEILINKLRDKELLNSKGRIKEGDLFLHEASFKFYDFNLLEKSLNVDFMKKIMLMGVSETGLSYDEAKKIINKVKPTAKDREQKPEALKIVEVNDQIKPILTVFDSLNLLGNFASNLLTDLSLIKAENNIGLLKKEYLRESAESLSFRTDNTRKAKMLFRIIGKKNDVYDGSNVLNLMENDLDIVPNIMLDIILGSFSILKKNDFMVTPIAIYYE